jgi:hypothetical protein
MEYTKIDYAKKGKLMDKTGGEMTDIQKRRRGNSKLVWDKDQKKIIKATSVSERNFEQEAIDIVFDMYMRMKSISTYPTSIYRNIAEMQTKKLLELQANHRELLEVLDDWI